MSTSVVIISFNRPEAPQRVFAKIAQMKPLKLLDIADVPLSGKIRH